MAPAHSPPSLALLLGATLPKPPGTGGGLRAAPDPLTWGLSFSLSVLSLPLCLCLSLETQWYSQYSCLQPMPQSFAGVQGSSTSNWPLQTLNHHNTEAKRCHQTPKSTSSLSSLPGAGAGTQYSEKLKREDELKIS